MSIGPRKLDTTPLDLLPAAPLPAALPPTLPTPIGLWKSALVWMIFCSLLFELVYDGCNWITAQRSDVGTWFFAWEMRIPFVPAMIVPYWSLDLFFVGSFFVCASLQELRILRNRLTASILIAGVCFLLFPLRLAFPRPDVTGAFGWLFAALRSFDQPYNLSPSLHIALRTIVYPVYLPRVTGVARLVLRVWFLLIGVSTIFTYQHQVIDIVTGWILAIVCLHLFAEEDPAIDRSWRVRNGRVGGYYAAGAIAVGVVAWLCRPVGAFFLWPGCALAIVAAGYLGLGSGVYRKRGASVQYARVARSRAAGPPIVAGYYRRQCRPWDKVLPGLLIGRCLSEREAEIAVSQGVVAVLDLTTEFSEAPAFLVATYRNLPLLDLIAPTTRQLQDAVGFLRDQIVRGTVYVHCKIGYSRSAAVVGAYLLECGYAANVDEALEILRLARPSIIVRPEALRALADFATSQATVGLVALPAAGG